MRIERFDAAFTTQLVEGSWLAGDAELETNRGIPRVWAHRMVAPGTVEVHPVPTLK
jgi:hypothetical protein